MTICELSDTLGLLERSSNLHAPQTLYPAATSIAEILSRRAEDQANDVAFVYLSSTDDEDVVCTYRELDQRARTVAGYLADEVQHHGSDRQLRVVLAYPPCADFADAYFGVLYAGATCVSAFSPTTQREAEKLAAIAADCGASIILTHSSTVEAVRSALEVAGMSAWPIVATDGLTGPGHSIAVGPSPNRPEDDCFIQYTSGSTSNPKGVRVKHANLMHNLTVIEHHMQGAKGSRYLGLGWLPVFHDMGLIACLNYPIYIGRPNVLFSHQTFAQKPHLWMSRISEYRATHTAGPNFAYELSARIARRANKEALDLSTLKVALCGAEPIRAATVGRFIAAYVDCGLDPCALAPAYGLAEATLMATGSPVGTGPRFLDVDREALQSNRLVTMQAASNAGLPRQTEGWTRRLVASGKLHAMHRLAIVDSDTAKELGEKVIGEVWLRSASVASGYLNKPSESDLQFKAQLAGGEGPFLRTGDLGFIADEHLYITGRLKDVIILNGANHHASDIEAAIENLGITEIRRSVAFAVNDMADREAVTIVCETRAGMELGRMEALAAKLANELAQTEGFSAGQIAFAPKGSIPRTSSGKIQRSLAKTQFIQNRLELYYTYSSARFSES